MSGIPKQQLVQLQQFIAAMKAKPDILHHPDLAFLKEYLESLGATIPPKSEKKESSPKPEEEKAATKMKLLKNQLKNLRKRKVTSNST